MKNIFVCLILRVKPKEDVNKYNKTTIKPPSTSRSAAACTRKKPITHVKISTNVRGDARPYHPRWETALGGKGLVVAGQNPVGLGPHISGV
jgi:hypothetical protein